MGNLAAVCPADPSDRCWGVIVTVRLAMGAKASKVDVFVIPSPYQIRTTA